MKTLLIGINTKFIHPCTAIYALETAAASYAERLGVSVGEIGLKEFTLQREYSDILGEILAEEADTLAFSVYIWNVALVKDLCRDLRKLRPDVTILLGGPEAFPETSPEADYLMRGEGERSFFALLLKLTNQLDAIPPEWVFRIAERNVTAAPAESLDEYPFYYPRHRAALKNRIIYYEASRGCPFGCSYCLSASEAVRARSLEAVLNELGALAGEGVPLVKLADRSFNFRPERTLALLDFMAALPPGCPTCFHLEIEAHLLSGEEIARLGALPKGRVQLEIGVQSANPEALRAVHRNPSTEKLFDNIRRLVHAGNMKVHTDLIAGLPLEGFDSFARSFNEVYALGADQLQLGFLKLLKGSPLETEAARYDLVFSERPPYEILQTPVLTPAELRVLKQVEDTLEKLHNSRRFIAFLEALLPLYDGDAFRMFRELADFRERRGYFLAPPSALEGFDALAEFVSERFGSSQAGFVSGRFGSSQAEPCGPLLDALLLDFYAMTASDRLPASPASRGKKPENAAALSEELLRSASRKAASYGTLPSDSEAHKRKWVVRFVNGEPVIYDYTARDAVSGRYEPLR